MMQDEDIRSRLSAGADTLRFDADAQLERLLRSRGSRVAVRRAATHRPRARRRHPRRIRRVARAAGRGSHHTRDRRADRHIAYMRVLGSGDTVEVMTASMGGASSALLGLGNFAPYPVWSPDGSKVAFGRGRDYDTVGLAVANADGSDIRAVGDRPIRGTMSWSPDGTRIAYVGSDRIGSPVYVVNADGTNEREVVGGWWTSVSWSPDGSLLLLSGHPATETNSYTEDGYDLYTVRPAGSGLEPVVVRKGYEHFGQWSPDGAEIVFTSGPSYDDATYDSDVYVMNTEGSNVRQLTTWEGFDSFPTWSPDGDWIAFATDREATAEQQRANRQEGAFANISIFAIRPDGTDLREVLPSGEGETL